MCEAMYKFSNPNFKPYQSFLATITEEKCFAQHLIQFFPQTHGL